MERACLRIISNAQQQLTNEQTIKETNGIIQQTNKRGINETGILDESNSCVFWYNIFMKNKSLLITNPYLKDPKKRRQIIETFVISSSAIESVRTAAQEAVIKARVAGHPKSALSAKAPR